ncbi:MAG TPA: hypothetical protein VK968_20555, partial [Roseimicrobium sp.]|nr:hypothetical protein [Roseimicrobium sp.]
MAPKSWRERWKVVKDLRPGGHGYAHVVQLKDEKSSDLFVLKKLINQSSSERRTRLAIEAGDIRVLNHPHIVRFIESNAEHYADKSVELYVVTE